MKPMIRLVILGLILLQASPAYAEQLSKESALAMAIKNNPRISASIARIKNAEGSKNQAALRPNPTAAFEIENFAGTNELEGFNGAEATIGIAQEIEIAGKRKKRTDVASYQLKINQENAIADALSLLAETDYAFMRLAIAQERVKLAEKRLVLADKTHTAVKKRVNAAAASNIQHTKADIEQSSAQLEKNKADAELTESQSALTALLVTQESYEAQAMLDQLPPFPERQILLDAIDRTPQIRAAAFLEMRAHSQLSLVKAQAKPNPTLGLSVRRLNDNDSTALVTGISFPLPVFNKNQGAIQQAKAKVVETAALARSQEINLRQSAINAWTKFAAAHNTAQAYQNDIVPSAERAYEQASKGYKAGRFSFLDLLDAQRTLYEVKEARLDSLLNLYAAKTQTDFLMNTHLALIEQHMILPHKGDTE